VVAQRERRVLEVAHEVGGGHELLAAARLQVDRLAREVLALVLCGEKGKEKVSIRRGRQHSHGWWWAMLGFMSIQFTGSIFLDFFQTKVLMINLQIVDHFMLHLTIYVKNLKKKQ